MDYDYEEQRFEYYKMSLQEKIVDSLVAMTSSGKFMDHVANIICRAYLEEDKDADLFFVKNKLDDLHAYAQLEMDTELYQKTQNRAVAE